VILHKIDHLKKQNLVKAGTRVFLDSPMGAKATEIYRSYRNLFNNKMKAHADQDDPFDFPGLKVTDGSKESRKVKSTNGPKVIIAGSGMMSGGRILNHAIDFLPIKTTRLLIVGFQAENTIGRKIIEGTKRVHIYGKDVNVNATVTELYSMSAHADQPRLLKWLKTIKGAKKVFLVHGEETQRDELETKIKEKFKIDDVVKPEINSSFPL